ADGAAADAVPAMPCAGRASRPTHDPRQSRRRPQAGPASDRDVMPDLPRQHPRLERSVGRPVRTMSARIVLRGFGWLCAGTLALPALADTGAMTGYGGAGNELNPAGQPLDLPRDPDGLSQLDDITRTPTGLLYPLPYAQPSLTQSTSDPDWWSLGWIR